MSNHNGYGIPFYRCSVNVAWVHVDTGHGSNRNKNGSSYRAVSRVEVQRHKAFLEAPQAPRDR